jgi:hypothetical protein
MPLRGKGKRKGKSENNMQGLSGIEEEMMNYVSVAGDGGGGVWKGTNRGRKIDLNEDHD